MKGGIPMEPVGTVDLDLVGGGEVGWARDELFERARAIHKKQAREEVGVSGTPLTLRSSAYLDTQYFKHAPKVKVQLDWVLYRSGFSYKHPGTATLWTRLWEPIPQAFHHEIQYRKNPRNRKTSQERRNENSKSPIRFPEPNSDNDSDEEVKPGRWTALGGKPQGLRCSYLTLSQTKSPWSTTIASHTPTSNSNSYAYRTKSRNRKILIMSRFRD
ncbi:hypothetical protein VNI00_015562 [Paramarasmius palmivorus]|uniref:Uncharacterized protein n=1 Tax=Paramarasmius palmivorus TaxID=297713 RepID=A0AAW0BKU5_9AGAR